MIHVFVKKITCYYVGNSLGFYRTYGFYKCLSLDPQSDEYNPDLHSIFCLRYLLKVSLHLCLALPICPFP